ncbi:GAF domain-containing sensor histidine kinase [Lacisediminihabitans sp. H27-G8]|uniref:GAF domain-containing sensor histidine kinase n=1 Tax=Lacisediminihabitans sp. H27-G8 TaxID=3111909 RepID=UPI0038FD0A80
MTPLTPLRELELRRLVDEEQSLRNVATLLAASGPTEDILTTICREASALLDGQEVSLLRFEEDDTVVCVATHNGPIPPGVRATYGPGSVPERVGTTRAPVRADDMEEWSDKDLVRPFGIRAVVAVPVFVEGAVWGMCSASSQTGPLSPRTEARLAGFAQLTWAAVAHTEARESLRRLADEQAALRGVAELVARESPLPNVFQAVVEAAARVYEAEVLLAEGDEKQPTGQRTLAHAGNSPETESRIARVPILIDDEAWGTLQVTLPASFGHITEEHLKAFADLAAAAISNADHREKLTESRARVIAAADEARRRLQRDVHDGAQQRLIHAIITLKLARDAAEEDLSELLTEALANAEEANRQLRDVVRGILPASLTRGGLAAGIRSLAVDTGLCVDLDLNIPRLPTSIETTGYFTVAEAITNATKHAHASRIRVSGKISDFNELILIVEDDGVGGAELLRGTGLLGLSDRIEASHGVLTITSPAGRGTRVTASIPVPGSAD